MRLILIWALLIVLTLISVAVTQRSARLSELTLQATNLLRLASQRADQHDAHLTSLSAIAVASEGKRPDLFLEVAATISTFYPRVSQVYLIPLAPEGQGAGTQQVSDVLRDKIKAAAQSSKGKLALLAHPDEEGKYVLVKRSPNSDAAVYGLAIVVDGRTLLRSDVGFWAEKGVTSRLLLPNGEPVTGAWPAGTNAQFSEPLGSKSQPLLLETSIVLQWSDLMPLRHVVTAVLIVSALFFAVQAGLRQRAKTREAEERAALSAHEARLNHASRVNSLGEMASGMAHELTQPLTAILAQAQAGRRLLAKGQAGALEPVLDDTIMQARRASGILERLRNWSRPQQGQPTKVDFREALNGVKALLSPEAERQGIELNFHVPAQSVLVSAHQVELEQVVFNLVRNAIEAMSEVKGDKRVDVILEPVDEQAVLHVDDTGPGVRDDLVLRLFTPFVTTRQDGTGLGLALSQRLVEKMGGEIEYVGLDTGARFRVSLPLKRTTGEAAE